MQHQALTQEQIDNLTIEQLETELLLIFSQQQVNAMYADKYKDVQ